MSELLNNEMNINVPEGFRILTGEDLAKYRAAEGAVNFGMQNEEKHIILTVSWKEYNSFLAMLGDPKEAIKKQESSIAKLMKDYSYRMKEFSEFKVGDLAGQGFTYTYDVQNTGMQGTSVIVKNGKVFYYIYAYCRQELADDGMKTVRDILADVSWQ